MIKVFTESDILLSRFTGRFRGSYEDLRYVRCLNGSVLDSFGLSCDKPATHMRECLEVLVPLMQGQVVNYQGEKYQVNCPFKVKGLACVPLIVQL
jgi:alkanesulfonate monooxygenase SsuD/methylene tetrahydromethanopterin reductase-like flavin-dependent oxidoreductase (luciferase family)